MTNDILNDKNLFHNFEFGVRGKLRGNLPNQQVGDNFHIIALYSGNSEQFNKKIGIHNSALNSTNFEQIFGTSTNHIVNGSSIKNNTCIPFMLCEGMDSEHNNILYFSSDYEDIFEMNVDNFRNGGLATLRYDDNDSLMNIIYKSKISKSSLTTSNTSEIHDYYSVPGNDLKNIKAVNIKNISKFSSADYNLGNKYVYSGVPYDLPNVNWVFKKTMKINSLNTANTGAQKYDGYINMQKLTLNDFGTSPLQNKPDIFNNIHDDSDLSYFLDFGTSSDMRNQAKYIAMNLGIPNPNNIQDGTSPIYNTIKDSNPDTVTRNNFRKIFKNMLHTSQGIYYNSIYNFVGGDLFSTTPSYTNPYSISQFPDHIYNSGTLSFYTYHGCSLNSNYNSTISTNTTRPIFIPSLKRYDVVSGTSLHYNGTSLSSSGSSFRFLNSNSGASFLSTDYGLSIIMEDIPINGYLGIVKSSTSYKEFDNGGDISSSNRQMINYYYTKEKNENSESIINIHFDKSIGCENYRHYEFSSTSGPCYIENIYFFRPPDESDFIYITDIGSSVDISDFKDNIKLYLIPSSDVSYLQQKDTSGVNIRTLDKTQFLKNGPSFINNVHGDIFHTSITPGSCLLNIPDQPNTDYTIKLNSYITAINNSFYFNLLKRNNGLGKYWAVNNKNATNTILLTYGDKNSLENYILQDNTTKNYNIRQSGNDNTNNIPIFFTTYNEAKYGVWYKYCKIIDPTLPYNQNELCGINNCMGNIDTTKYLTNNLLDISREFNIDTKLCSVNRTNIENNTLLNMRGPINSSNSNYPQSAEPAVKLFNKNTNLCNLM